MNTVGIYWITIIIGGIGVFIALLRLLSSSWRQVFLSLIYAWQPWWRSQMDGELAEDFLSSIKVTAIALATAYLVFYFHWKAGDWWMGIVSGLV